MHGMVVHGIVVHGEYIIAGRCGEYIIAGSPGARVILSEAKDLNGMAVTSGMLPPPAGFPLLLHNPCNP